MLDEEWGWLVDEGMAGGWDGWGRMMDENRRWLMDENDEGSLEPSNYEAISVDFTSGKREISGPGGRVGVRYGDRLYSCVHDHGSTGIRSNARPSLALSCFRLGYTARGAVQSRFLVQQQLNTTGPMCVVVCSGSGAPMFNTRVIQRLIRKRPLEAADGEWNGEKRRKW